MRAENKRVLIVDDNASIHDDFRKVLATRAADQVALQSAEAALFDDEPVAAQPSAELELFELDFALQGEQAVDSARRARADGKPFAMAFVDMRMPPGIDGVETIERIWAVDPDVQVVVCTAFSDHSWQDVVRRLGRTDRLLILKKPFDTIEVCQLATALTEKWNAALREREHLAAAQRAEGEARAYAASLETTNNAIEASWRRTEAELSARRQLLLNIADTVLAPTLEVLAQSIASLDSASGGAPSTGKLEDVVDRSTDLVHTIQGLIELAEIDGGRDRAVASACSPRDLADQLARRAEDAVQGKPIDVLYRCAPALPATVKTVPERVRRVLDELVDNAARNTERGSLTIEVGLHESSDSEGPMLRFAITDTGRGVAESTVNALFEPFCKTDATDTRAGLGLAVCSRLAGALGGRLRYVRPAQTGATFELFLPSR
ncbi:MAG: hybrid sensor histidine kinase/response regulator [Planctomycetes bacterium]|nr:hybrid sensor histidine kinase/response regulator [Planctomycetota bacterium]